MLGSLSTRLGETHIVAGIKADHLVHEGACVFLKPVQRYLVLPKSANVGSPLFKATELILNFLGQEFSLAAVNLTTLKQADNELRNVSKCVDDFAIFAYSRPRIPTLCRPGSICYLEERAAFDSVRSDIVKKR
jgi:hypothetical protein